MKSRRALSLAEVLVAASLFSLVLLAIYLIYNQTMLVQRKTAAQNEAYRAVMLAMKHVEMELHGAQVVQPSSWTPDPAPLATISYLYPTLQNEQIVVDPTGTPMWAGRAHFELDASGRFSKIDETTPAHSRWLSSLGKNGAVSFWRPERDLLRLRIYAELPDAFGRTSSSYRFQALLRLANQP